MRSVIQSIIKIENITCKNQYGACNETIMAQLESALDNNLIESKKELKKTLLEDFLIKDFTVRFQLPNAIEVFILERNPKYALLSKKDINIYSLDKDGIVISLTKSTTLPYVITNEANYSLGDRVSDELLFASEIMFDVSSTHKVRRGLIENKSLVIEIDQGPRVIFHLGGDRKVLVGSLNLIVSRLNSLDDNSKIKRINLNDKIVDLRFNNPVIR